MGRPQKWKSHLANSTTFSGAAAPHFPHRQLRNHLAPRRGVLKTLGIRTAGGRRHRDRGISGLRWAPRPGFSAQPFSAGRPANLPPGPPTRTAGRFWRREQTRKARTSCTRAAGLTHVGSLAPAGRRLNWTHATPLDGKAARRATASRRRSSAVSCRWHAVHRTRRLARPHSPEAILAGFAEFARRNPGSFGDQYKLKDKYAWSERYGPKLARDTIDALVVDRKLIPKHRAKRNKDGELEVDRVNRRFLRLAVPGDAESFDAIARESARSHPARY